MSSLRFRGAGARVNLVGLDRSLADVVDLVRDVGHGILLPEQSGGGAHERAPDTVVRIRQLPDGVHLIDGELLPATPDEAAASVLGAVDRALLGASRCLSVHAAVVAGAGGAAIAPGVSGTGKTTLAAAAMQHGLRLVSDEAACVDPHDDVLHPYPRPLGLSRRSRDLLGLPTPLSGPVDEERATAPSLLGRTVPTDQLVRPTVLVLAQREPAPFTGSVTEGSTGEGLSALLANCLNTGLGGPWTPEEAWARLAELVRSLSVVRLRYSTPKDGAELLGSLLG